MTKTWRNILKIFLTLVLIAAIIGSILISGKTSDPLAHQHTLASLDTKKETVLTFVATVSAAATAIAAVPGDATTPIADELADLCGWFLLILAVLFVEKYLVTLSGILSFALLIPLSGVFLIIGLWGKRRNLLMRAGKIAAFALILFFLIPVSVQLSDFLENTSEVSASYTELLEEAQGLTEDIQDNTDSEGNWLTKTWEKITGSVSDFTDRCQKLLNDFLEKIAFLLVINCGIPLGVALLLMWLAKLLFSGSISTVMCPYVQSCRFKAQDKDTKGEFTNS